jgi:hypothetical protein
VHAWTAKQEQMAGSKAYQVLFIRYSDRPKNPRSYCGLRSRPLTLNRQPYTLNRYAVAYRARYKTRSGEQRIGRDVGKH